MKKGNIGSGTASGHFAAHVVPANTRFLDVSNRENAIGLAQALWDTTGCMPALTRHRNLNLPQECWRVHYSDGHSDHISWAAEAGDSKHGSILDHE